MKKIILFIILVCVLNLTTVAFKLSGSVYDSELMPVEGAEVYVNGVGPYLTSQEGTFSVNTEGRIKLIIAGEGFSSYIRDLIITEDSTLSVMLKPAVERQKVSKMGKGDHLIFMPGSYGLTGGFEVIYPYTNGADKYDISFAFLRLDHTDASGRDLSRNVSSLRGSYGFADDIEIGLSLFITEDNNFTVLNEENIFAVKKIFHNPWFPAAVSGIIRDNQNMLIFSGAYPIQSDITAFMQFIYNDSLSREKLDLAFEYRLRKDISVSLELLQDYSNDWRNYAIKLNRTLREYDVFLFGGKNRKADYTYISAGFNSSF